MHDWHIIEEGGLLSLEISSAFLTWAPTNFRVRSSNSRWSIITWVNTVISWTVSVIGSFHRAAAIEHCWLLLRWKVELHPEGLKIAGSVTKYSTFSIRSICLLGDMAGNSSRLRVANLKWEMKTENQQHGNLIWLIFLWNKYLWHRHHLFLLLVAVGVTSIVQWSIFVQGEERGIEQHRVVVLHDDPLVLCLDPWLVLIGWTEQRRGETEEAFGSNGAIRKNKRVYF